MELVRSLQELWHRRLWVAPGLIVAAFVALSVTYNVSLSPPSLKSQNFEYATAETQVYVDSSNSTLADINRDVAPLTTRAALYARFMTSPTFVAQIAHTAHLEGVGIAAEGPVNVLGSTTAAGSSSQRRAGQIANEGPVYRLRFEPEADLPILTILAQAPTPKEAERMANGAATALKSYVSGIQSQQKLSSNDRAQIKQLGPAVGSAIAGGGTSKAFGVVAFLLTFVAWCVGVLMISGIARNVARQRVLDAMGGGLEGQQQWHAPAGDEPTVAHTNGTVPDDVSAGIRH